MLSDERIREIRYLLAMLRLSDKPECARAIDDLLAEIERLRGELAKK